MTLPAAALALLAMPAAAHAAPNDPFYAKQWGLRAIHAPQAWATTTGATAVKVAVVDSGINFDQPDFAGNLWRNPGESGGGREDNGVDDDHNGFVDDYRGWDFIQGDNDPSDNYGHGTHVAGTLAARGGNGLGVAGVAWRASIIPVRVLDNVDGGSCEELAAGIAYAAREGARIVNLSTGRRLPCKAEEDAIAAAPNVLFVAAAMNDGKDVDADPYYPCAYPEANIVCVAATDAHDRLPSFSDYGARSVDLAAPGQDILAPYVKWAAKQSVLSEDFESPLAGRWTTGGSPDTWQRTPFAPIHGGGFSLAPSLLGAFAGDADSWARLTGPIDLSGRRDCGMSVQLSSTMSGFDPSKPIEAQDRLILELSTDGTHWERRPSVLTGRTDGFLRWVYDLSPLEGHATGTVRFRLVTNGDGVNGTLALDDLEVFCVPPLTHYTGTDADEFILDWGTSMAAPHVAGTAALMLAADPHLSAVEMRRRLLASVDRVPGLAGRVASGGRLNAARALVPPARAATPPPPSQAYALSTDVKAIALALERHGLRYVLRHGVRASRLHAFSAGRFTLVVRSRGRRVARASRACAGPAVCSMTARVSRRGRRVLRRSRHPRLALALTFAPRTGAPLVHRAAVRLGR